jgi:hypothetical protein
MLRVLHILLLVLLAGAQIGSSVLTLTAECDACHECSTGGAGTCQDCPDCACCAISLPGNLVSSTGLPAPARMFAAPPLDAHFSLSPHHSEILHIPEAPLA